MTNYLTPEERIRLAQRVQEARASRLGYSPTDTSALSYYLPKTVAHPMAQPLSRQVRGETVSGATKTKADTREEEDEAAWYDRVGATVLDTVANVGLGAADVFEGIYDIGAGLVGEIGGWFSEDFKKAVTDHIDDDWTGNLEKTLDDLGLEHSYLNEEGVGEFVGGVARGVGGLLPAVAVTAAASYFSGGTLTAPTIQALGLGTTIGGAAGQSTEEALNEGASLGKALNYGVLSGAVEGVTEKLVGGPTSKIFGKGFFDSGEAVAKTGAKRIFKDMLGEGIEEGLATSVRPLTKTTYKGAEALGEYTEPEFYGDILHDAASGAAVSAAFGGTVGRIMHTSGKDADIQDSIEAIKNNNKEGARLVAENGALTESEEAKLRENKLKNIANIENALQSVSDEKRAKLIERHNLKSLFDESGKISPDFKAELMGGTVEAPNAENGAVEDGTGGSVPSGGVDRRYASYGLWGKQKTVDADLAAMTEDYRKITKDESARVELFRGELTDAEAEAFASARREIHKLSDRTATGIELALVEGSSATTRVNGVMKGNTVYLSKESLSDGSWAETTVEEVSHFAEGTESYRKVIKFLAKDERFADAVLNSLTADGNPYGFTKADVDSILKKLGTRNAYVLDRRSSAGYNVSAQFDIENKENDLYTTTDAFISEVAPSDRRAFARSLANKTSGIQTGEKRPMVVYCASRIYLFEADGYMHGKMVNSVSAHTTEDISEVFAYEYEHFDENTENAYSLPKGLQGVEGGRGRVSDVYRGRRASSSDTLHEYTSGGDASRDNERGRTIDQEKEEYDEIIKKLRKMYGLDKDTSQFSLKSTSEGAQAAPADSEPSSGEALTEKERMLINEVRAHLSAEALGSEAFVRRIIESDASLAEKLINRIKSLKNAFTGSKDPSVRAQSTRLSKAEKLWLKAVDDAGYKYAAGKIVKMLEKEKERQDEERAKGPIVSIEENGELATRIQNSTRKKYDVIREFLIEKLSGHDFNLSDGRIAIMDNSDAKELSHNANDVRTVQLGNLRELVEQAKYDHSEYDVNHKKFVDFHYYAVVAKYDGEEYPLWINVGVAKNDGSNHIYSITKNQNKKEAPTNKGVAGPVGNQLQNASSKDSIHQTASKINPSEQKTSEKDSQSSEFSLSSKQESDGARAKANANRSRSKTYTRAEAAAIMNAVAEGATDAEGNPIRIKGQKGKLIDALWERLNEVDENSGKRGGMALDIANHMIRASVVEDLEYDPAEEVYLERLDVLNGYRNKLDLSSLRGEIKHAYDDKSGRVYLTWSQKDGGMTPDAIKAELAERGIVIEANNPADILFEMDRMYTEAREYFKQKTNARLSDWMNADELNAYRQSLAQKILKETEGKGSASELARDYRRREADFKRREAFMKEEITRMRKDFKTSSDLVYKVGKLRKQLTDGIKKQHSVKSFNDPRFKGSLGRLTGMTRAGQLLDKNTRRLFASVNEWYTKENELFRDHSTDDGKIEPNRYYNEEVKACLEALAKGKGRLTGEDIKRADLAFSYFSKLIETYNMVYRNGKYVDAVEIAKKNIANVKRTKLLKRGMMHKIYQKGLADIVDPVTLMRYADGYESGFFVETFEELRRGAMEMAFTRMELMEDYDAFFKEHKAYSKRMEEVVEFRGVKIPRNVLLSAYMTSKREHSHKGFVESGSTFKDPKTGDGVRIAPLGDPSVKYTDGEIKTMIARMQKEIEAHFNDTDRAYISMVEKIFDRCADIKTETDMHRLGFTNVDKGAYYYPIARATRPINLDSDSVLEAMERVNSLSMNKDTVKGANAMLYIDTVDAVFRRHVNQVSLYHGLADAVDNFNKLVNLNVNDGPGVPISVNTELDSAFGKMALNYLRTMKNDIEGMATLSESDRKLQKFITNLRGKYATFQLGANPKVWASQLSSILSSSNLLDYKSIMYGITHVSAKEAAYGGEASKTRIEVGMSEDRRAEILRKKIIKPTAIQIAEGFDVDIEALERNRKSIVEKPLLKKLRELGFLKGYQADGVNVDFEFTAKSLRKSMNAQVSDYGGNLADLAKVVMNLDPLLENAVLLEVHRDKAKDTPKENPQLVQTYVLLSAYTEGDSVTPVQFEVKQFVDDQNRLYLAVALTKIKKTGVMDDTILENQASTRLLPVSDISISRLIENINPSDENFFKYVPDAMLTEEQIRAKDRALEKEARKYGKDPKEYVKNYRIKDDASDPQKTEEKDVDKYCRLAKLRHSENTVVEAQSVMKRSTNKLTELSMKPIGGVDRFVINRLWGACQAQVEANHKGDSSMKIGKEANKKEAGRLLERVILETQQNSLMTERSAWMRSRNELVKGLTMFSADAMKNVGRVFDGIGEIHVLKQELKSETLTENERKALEARLKEARKRAVRASAALIANAVFMAAVALFFQSLMRQNEDKEPEEIAHEVGVDAIGNLLGGIPLLRDAYGFFANGYEIDNFLLSTMNDFLTTVQGSIETIGKWTDGTLTSQDAAKAVRDVVYSTGQLSGLPFRNLYKYSTGLIARISPSAGYWIGSQFKHNPYRADLKKAIDAGDTHMISTIAGLITDENYGGQSKEVRDAVRELAAKGHVVLPRTLSDTVTVNSETVTLTDAQKAKMQQVYAASDKAVDELVTLKMFKDATDEEKAKALGKIYDLYYNLAVDHALGLETEERSVLFAEALDVELLAMISARAGELKADVDKNGKAISGSRKAKVTKLVSSLRLTATEKYMVMGFLGYRQTNGANQVKAYINKLDLSKTEKEKLYAYCGYGAVS